ncbi:MlaD family protein [Jongsikchunia kroppenstedtii]|uniref:MlaD family protein n=1 Tax=Jongsikchunia kroppenstedtii TaxID=1121721 RepID=UPI0003A362CA|nr:MCE family protein [Jongsikchunia kroppenstedtii]
MTRIDTGGRDPSATQYVVRGLVFLVIVVILIAVLFMRATGTFNTYVKVKANMSDVGDGLLSAADVRYNGMIVGAVKKVANNPNSTGHEAKTVTLYLDPTQAKGIPENITARTVPTNLFGVNSVELVPPAEGATPTGHLSSHSATIPEDTSEATLTLQDAMNDLRQLFEEVPPSDAGKVFTALGDAVSGGGSAFSSFVPALAKYMSTINEMFPAGAPPGFDNFNNALKGIAQSTPRLLNALGASIKPSLTVLENQRNLVAFIKAGQSLTDQTQAFFAQNGDAGKRLVGDGSRMLGALTLQPNGLTDMLTATNRTLAKILTIFSGANGHIQLNLGVSFSPLNQYSRVNCPVYNGGPYGVMRGPGCTGPGTGTGPTSSGPINVSPVSATVPAPGAVTTGTDNAALQSVMGRQPSATDTLGLGPVVSAARSDASGGGAK